MMYENLCLQLLGFEYCNLPLLASAQLKFIVLLGPGSRPRACVLPTLSSSIYTQIHRGIARDNLLYPSHARAATIDNTSHLQYAIYAHDVWDLILEVNYMMVSETFHSYFRERGHGEEERH